MSRVTEYLTVQGYHLRETDKAVQFEVHEVDGDPLPEPKTEWFPLSQMKAQDYNKEKNNEFDTLTASKWICQQKGLV